MLSLNAVLLAYWNLSFQGTPSGGQWGFSSPSRRFHLLTVSLSRDIVAGGKKEANWGLRFNPPWIDLDQKYLENEKIDNYLNKLSPTHMISMIQKYHLVSSISSVQFSSVTQPCPTLFDPMNCSTPGLPVHHQLLVFTQTRVH